MDAYEGLVEKVTDLTLVRCMSIHTSSTFKLISSSKVRMLPACAEV